MLRLAAKHGVGDTSTGLTFCEIPRTSQLDLNCPVLIRFAHGRTFAYGRTKIWERTVQRSGMWI